MSTTRSPLGSLASEVNVHGEESLSRRVPRERTHLERQAERMYERGEETWRRLTRQRVDAFFELFLLAMVRVTHSRRVSKCCLASLSKGLSPESTDTACGQSMRDGGPCHWNIFENWTMIWPIICQPFMRAINGERSECISGT